MIRILISLLICRVCFGQAFAPQSIVVKSWGGSSAVAAAPGWQPTNTFGWWETLSNSSLTLVNATNIAAMLDLSGHGFNATNLAANTTRPTVTNISSRQYAHFNPAFAGTLVHGCTLTQSCSIYIVVRVNETGAQRGICITAPNQTSFCDTFANTGSGATATNWGTYINGFKTSSYNDNSFHVLVNVADGNTSGAANTLYTDLNAGEVTSTGTRQVNGVANCNFGSNPFAGATTLMDLGEVICYNRILAENERTNCIAYLMNKWGIP